MKRSYGRSVDQLRPLTITYDFFDYASGSVLLQLGKTKVACSVNLQENVPHFLKGKRTGWLTAEYAMLPAATQQRTEREGCKRNGRNIEISRLIGRTFRSILNLDVIGERTIVIDCDVLQADGSTRTACITGAYLALRQAAAHWAELGIITSKFITDELAAVSVGIQNGIALLDIDFAEDSAIDADFNFVMTRAGAIIEVQGTAERKPIDWELYQELHALAVKGVSDIFNQVQGTMHQEVVDAKQVHKSKQPFNSIRLIER